MLTGRYSGVLPCLGVFVCRTVCFLAGRCSGSLVCALGRVFCIQTGCVKAYFGIRASRLVGNSLYLVAFSYYSVVSFLGYNGKFSFPNVLYSLLVPLHATDIYALRAAYAVDSSFTSV